MNREQAKELLPIIQAFAESKTIQVKAIDGMWHDDEDMLKFDSSPQNYRIKSEQKYRLFKNAEECWKEMQKHQPFGWIKSKDDSTINKFMFIDSLQNNAANICTSCDSSYNKLTECYIFADGMPFGIKEE